MRNIFLTHLLYHNDVKKFIKISWKIFHYTACILLCRQTPTQWKGKTNLRCQAKKINNKKHISLEKFYDKLVIYQHDLKSQIRILQQRYNNET